MRIGALTHRAAPLLWLAALLWATFATPAPVAARGAASAGRIGSEFVPSAAHAANGAAAVTDYRRSADGTTRLQIDLPAPGAGVDPVRTLTVSGWAVDPTALSAAAPAGIDAIHVYLNGPPGTGVLLGAAELGLPRPDVAAALGDARLRAAGFRFEWRPAVTLSAGEQTLYLYARNLQGEWTEETRAFLLPAAPALAVAVATAAFTERTLGVPVGGPDCAAAQAFGYRRGDDEPQFSDNWYDTSQLLADAMLVASGREDARCRLRKGYEFIMRAQWDRTRPIGGFHPRTTADGSRLIGSDKYVDDNALAGLALIAAAVATPDPAERKTYLDTAEATANYLINGGVWDSIFEGGFWWNDHKGDTEEGKSAQTNAVAAFFFLRLHRETGNPLYRDWGLRTLDWMDRVLWVESKGLYRWSIRYENLQTRTGVVRSERYFNYDQSIAAEAWLEVHRLLGPSSGSLERARGVLERLRAGFWSSRLGGGYDLEQGVAQVFTGYSAWITPAFIRMYQADGDARWLALARENVDALDLALRDEAGGGYFYVMFLEDGRRIIGREKHTVAQAWMQYALTATAFPERLVP